MKPLAPDFKIVYKSKNPQKEYGYSGCIHIRPNGRYIGAYDVSDRYGKICVSDDKGDTWNMVCEEDFFHGSLFADGDTVYLLAAVMQKGFNLVVFRSDDNGDSWSGPHYLTDEPENEDWFHCATDVWYKDGYVYIVMDKRIVHEGEIVRSTWRPCVFAPVVLRGKLGENLTKRENWLFSNQVRFRDVIDEAAIDGFGIPFFKSMEELGDNDVNGETFWHKPDKYRHTYDFENDKPSLPLYFHATGWLEANIVQITDPKHYWYDPTGKTLHIFMRCNTHGTGYCAMMKAVERVRDGKEVIDIECEVNPSGKRVIFLPMPGGQNKFFIKYDEKTKLYWLASVQSIDSMTRVEFLSDDRFNLPSDERNRLALHFSKNMVDWVFAGLVAKDDNERRTRHYASMDFDGEDLVIFSRSGDENTKDAHDNNLITQHTIKNFRDLVY